MLVVLILVVLFGVDPLGPVSMSSDGPAIPPGLAPVHEIATGSEACGTGWVLYPPGAGPFQARPGAEPGRDQAFAGREPEPQVIGGRMTTAAEVRPVLEATRDGWVNWTTCNDQDHVDFLALSLVRCGLWEVRFGLNGAPPDRVLGLPPCREGAEWPNQLLPEDVGAATVTLPGGSVRSVSVEVVFDDGSTDAAIITTRR